MKAKKLPKILKLGKWSVGKPSSIRFCTDDENQLRGILEAWGIDYEEFTENLVSGEPTQQFMWTSIPTKP